MSIIGICRSLLVGLEFLSCVADPLRYAIDGVVIGIVDNRISTQHPFRLSYIAFISRLSLQL